MRPARNAAQTDAARVRTSKTAANCSRRSLIVCALRSTSAEAAGWRRLGGPHGRARGASGVQRGLRDTPEILPRACARRTSIKPGARLGKHGAEGGTRTPTGCPTRPSNVRVCQFRHFGPGTVAKYTLTSASAKPSHALTQPRIERIANALAEQVVGEHGEEDGEARIDRQPPRELDDFLALVEDVAPRRVRRTHAEAEERQARLGEDG